MKRRGRGKVEREGERKGRYVGRTIADKTRNRRSGKKMEKGWGE